MCVIKLWDSIFLSGNETYHLPDREVKFVKTLNEGPAYHGRVKIPKYIINDFAREEVYSVFYHEIGHSRPIGILFYVIILYFFLKAIFLVLFRVLITLPPRLLIDPFMKSVFNFFRIEEWNFLLFIGVSIFAIILKWTLEIYCDLYSVSKTKSRDIISAIRKLPKRDNILSRFVGKLSHPKDEVRFWFITKYYKWKFKREK